MPDHLKTTHHIYSINTHKDNQMDRYGEKSNYYLSQNLTTGALRVLWFMKHS